MVGSSNFNSKMSGHDKKRTSMVILNSNLEISKNDQQKTSIVNDNIEHKKNINPIFVSFLKNQKTQKYLESFFEKEDWEKQVAILVDKFNCDSFKTISLKKTLQNRALRIPFMLAVTLNVLNQLTGINAINYYSRIIFTELNFKDPELLTFFICNLFIFISMSIIIIIIIFKVCLN